MVHYLNFVQFYLEKGSFLAKKWRSNPEWHSITANTVSTERLQELFVR